jgi:integrase
LQRVGNRELSSLTADETFQFLDTLTKGAAPSTRRLRYAQLKALFNFWRAQGLWVGENPCNHPLHSKAFKTPRPGPRRVLEKDAVDELIYRAPSLRDRLLIELQARCGLRIGEVLSLRPQDLHGRKLLICEPKGGREAEYAYLPEQITERLRAYIALRQRAPHERIFSISYGGARKLIQRLAARGRLYMTPHDLRRFAATYASRNGVPLEIISKVILRHQDLRTTQVYLGRVSDAEAYRWMDSLHGS